MRVIKTVFVLASVLVMSYATASFIQKREKKGPSLATLKEDCCQAFGDVLEQVSPCLSSISELQKEALAAIKGHLQGDKESFCAQASRQKLAACTERLQVVHEKMGELLQEFQGCISELQQ